MSPNPHLSVDYERKALPLSLTRRVLRAQQQHIYAKFAGIFPPDPTWRVLDLGANGAIDEPERAFFEQNYPYRKQVVAAGLEEGTGFRRCYPDVQYVQVHREEKLPFVDAEFDMVFCSAVIEHVGSREQQRRFLAEVLRVARRAFVTTPNRWYPIELHTVTPFLHWMPPTVYRKVFRALGFDFFSREENLNLLDRKDLLALVPASWRARMHTHRFLGPVSNLLLELVQG